MTDIVEKLSKYVAYVAGMVTRNSKDYTAFLTVAEVMEAANEIQKLREKVADLEAELEILEHSGGYGV